MPLGAAQPGHRGSCSPFTYLYTTTKLKRVLFDQNSLFQFCNYNVPFVWNYSNTGICATESTAYFEVIFCFIPQNQRHMSHILSLFVPSPREWSRLVHLSWCLVIEYKYKASNMSTLWVHEICFVLWLYEYKIPSNGYGKWTRVPERTRILQYSHEGTFKIKVRK